MHQGAAPTKNQFTKTLDFAIPEWYT